jgi:hypothetical protein
MPDVAMPNVREIPDRKVVDIVLADDLERLIDAHLAAKAV